MPKMRTLSATEVLAILGEFGFRPVSQRGSHLKLRRAIADASTQTLTVPNPQGDRPRHSAGDPSTGKPLRPGI